MCENLRYEPGTTQKSYHGVKKEVVKFTDNLLSPYIRFQNSVNEHLQNEIKIRDEKIAELTREQNEQMKDMTEELQEMRQQLQELTEHFGKAESDLGAVSRQVMLAKWNEIDRHLGETESADDVIKCNICGFSQRRGDYETKETDCIFNGGHLTRYVCPQCGVIFGPTKFLAQGQKGIDEDYWVHYLGFSEGDSSYKETRAFYMLNPTKEGVYLNYGCGHWSKSLQQLRAEGYQVYGYEPYSPDIDNPYMITSREQLERMRFDGIYSNDLLEHLINPVEDLKFMSSLLFRKESRMAHCTACYIYKYEYTRFHTHFFTGDSVSVLAKNSGLEIIDFCDDMEENDFICYVYGIQDDHVGFLDSMKIKNDGKKEEKGIALDQNGIVYGPYFKLLPGEYRIHIVLEGDISDTTVCVNADCGASVFYQGRLQQGDNLIGFDLDKAQDTVEFVIENKGESILITDIYFE